MKTFGLFCFTLIHVILGPIWKGYILSILWRWFVVATFGLPTISIPIAIGLCIVAAMIISHPIRHDKDDRPSNEKLLCASVAIFLGPLMALTFGWIVKLWI